MAATLLNADEGRLMQLPPLLGPDFDVPRQTLAVEPGLDGGVAVEGRDEPVAGRHIRRHLLNLQVIHVPTVLGVPHVGIVARPAVRRRPVFLPRRYDIEDVGPGAVGVAVGRYPGFRIILELKVSTMRKVAYHLNPKNSFSPFFSFRSSGVKP